MFAYRGFAPFPTGRVGGYLQHYFGWNANFYFLMGYAVLMLAASCFIPETLHQKIEVSVKQLLNNYQTILKSRLFLAGVFYVGTTYSMIIIFNVVGPFLLQTVLHYSPIQFGHIALGMGFAFLLGGLLNRILVSHYSVETLFKLSLSIILIVSLSFLTLGYSFGVNIYSFIIPIFIVLFFSAFILPIGMAQCMSMFPHMAGIANSMMSFLYIIITSVSTALISLVPSTTIVPMAYAYVILTLICFVAYIVTTDKFGKLIRRH